MENKREDKPIGGRIRPGQPYRCRRRTPMSSSTDPLVALPEPDLRKVNTRSVTVYYHTHWDREWYRTFEDYQHRLGHVLDGLLEQLETQEISHFTLDGQTIVLEDYSVLRPPEVTEQLKQWIQKGNVDVGPWYVMPDAFLVSGESLYRNLQLGTTMAKAWGTSQEKTSGAPSWVGYIPDGFGHPQDFPYLFHQFGIETLIGWRGFPKDDPIFYWESPQGVSALTYTLVEGYFMNIFHEKLWDSAARHTRLESLLKSIKEKQQGRLPTDISLPLLLPVGGDHLATLPTTSLGQLQESLATLAPGYTIGSLGEFANRLHETLAPFLQGGDLALPRHKGDMTHHERAFVLPGVYSARLYLKQANRKLEHQLTQQVEPLWSLVHAIEQGWIPAPQKPPTGEHRWISPRYPTALLAESWKTLLQNHPHDSICGCSLDEVHRTNEARFDQVAQRAHILQREAQWHLNTQFTGPHQWIIWNTSDRPYSGVVPVSERQVVWAKGYEPSGWKPLPSYLHQRQSTRETFDDDYHHSLLQNAYAENQMVEHTGWIWVEHIPPLGFAVLDRQAVFQYKQFPYVQHHDSPFTLENEYVRVWWAEAEAQLKVFDKVTQKTHSPWLHWRSTPEQGDSYNGAPIPGAAPHMGYTTPVGFLHQGPLVTTLLLQHHFPAQTPPEKTPLPPSAYAELTLTTRITLQAGCPVVGFETQWENCRSHHKLQAVFHTGHPVSRVDAEGHWSIVERTYDPDFRIENQMPAPAQVELKPNTGPIQRFVSANQHSWITEGLTEYEVMGPHLALTLFRGFDMLSKPDTGVRGANAGPPIETPEGQSLGRQFSFRYGWMATPASTSDLYYWSKVFYGSAWGEQGREAPRPLDTQPSPPNQAVSLLQWENPHISLLACHWISTNTLQLRLLNTTSEVQETTLAFGIPITSLTLTNGLGDAVGTLSPQKPVLTLAPWTFAQLDCVL